MKLKIHLTYNFGTWPDLEVSKEFELPFAPFAGLRIIDSGMEIEIDRPIRWDIEKQQFIVFLYRKTTHLREDLLDEFEEIISDFYNKNWQIRDKEEVIRIRGNLVKKLSKN